MTNSKHTSGQSSEPSSNVSLTQRLIAFLTNPFGVMSLVILMYVVKATLKITVGHQINSPMIEGDGYHNLADILEALAVIVVIWVAKRPASSDYPFGKKNVEFFTSLAIGGALLVMAVQFALKSAVGLLSLAPSIDQAVRAVLPLPVHEPLLMSTSTLPWVLALTIGSVILSLVVSRYQIAMGKRGGHASMIADGKETASDGRIEIITVIGVVGEYLFNAPWLEYPLGLVVAFAIAHTGYELFQGGLRVLLQHSIGQEHEEEITKRCLAVAGVNKVESLKTFQIGSTAVCILTITTEHRTGTISHLKYGIEYHIKQYLLENGFSDCELNVKFEKPEPARHRIAYAVVENACSDGAAISFVVAPSVTAATHIVVCDLENGMVVRTKQEEKPADLASFLDKKRVVRLYLFTAAPAQLPGSSVSVLSSTSYQAELLGLC
jgi:cation diffusion facilitator family transporter